MNSELDEFLSRPLAEVPDRGFSAHVLARIDREKVHNARVDALTWTVLALSATAALAVSPLGRELAAMAVSLNGTAQIGLALTVILLVFAFREAAD